MTHRPHVAAYLAAFMLLVASLNAQPDSLIDPTRPHDAAVDVNYDPASRGPVLQSTVVSATRKSALISGKRVRVGDTYDGAVVTEITPFSVRMSKAGRETTLRLLPKLTKEKGVE